MRPTDETESALHSAANNLAAVLKAKNKRIVFAESCTAGLVAATLGRVPGISQHLCGSAVTYRNDTKHRWLGVPTGELEDPGPVSAVVAERMAAGALNATPEADIAVVVTGHLGPNAPDELDGLVFVGIASRETEPISKSIRLPGNRPPNLIRLERQHLAATLVLEIAADQLNQVQPDATS